MVNGSRNERLGDHTGEIITSADLLILDEGHRIKGAANIYKALKKVKTNLRIIISGTPLQNHLIELWRLVDFVKPRHLGPENRFRDNFVKPIFAAQVSPSMYVTFLYVCMCA